MSSPPDAEETLKEPPPVTINPQEQRIIMTYIREDGSKFYQEGLGQPSEPFVNIELTYVENLEEGN